MSTSAVVPEFKAKAGVYALVDPRSNRVQYVGQSMDVDYRFRQHVDPNVWDSNREKARWIAGLRSQGLVPKLVILSECEWPESDDVEKQFIRNYKITGQCELNKASGGRTDRGVSRLKNGHKDDWFQLGLKVKEARSLLMDIVAESGRLAGAKPMGVALQTVHMLDSFKARMEEKLFATFPEWADISRVFYGPTDPRKE